MGRSQCVGEAGLGGPHMGRLGEFPCDTCLERPYLGNDSMEIQ